MARSGSQDIVQSPQHAPPSLGHPGLLCLLSWLPLRPSNCSGGWATEASVPIRIVPTAQDAPSLSSPFDACSSSKPQPIYPLFSCPALVTSTFFPFFYWSVSPKLITFIHLFKKHNFWLCWSFLFYIFSNFCSYFYYFFSSFFVLNFAFFFAISWDEYLAHWVFSAYSLS